MGSVLVLRPDASGSPDAGGRGMAGMDMRGGAGLACSKFLKFTTRGGGAGASPGAGLLPTVLTVNTGRDLRGHPLPTGWEGK